MLRPTRIFIGMALMVASAVPVAAQSAGPLEATVSVPEVEMRSGPSPQFYATGKLRQGDRVKIVKEENGWLAIAPPPGSFSWINGRFIERHGPTATVLGDKVPVLVGSSLSNQKPDRRQVELLRGSQVVILGEAHVDEDGRWWPIQPHPSEVRYIPKDTVSGPRPPVEVSAQRPATPSGPNPAAASGWANPGNGSAVGGGNADAFWHQAQQAEQTGNYAEATRLYQECAKIADHSLSILCFNRIQALRDGNRGSVPPGYQQGLPREASSGDNRLVPTPATTVGRATSQYCYVKDAPPPPPGVQAQPTSYAPPANYPPTATSAPASPTQMSGPGRLSRATFFIDGKQAYVLSQGQSWIYVTALPGLNLEAYVNRNVNLYGPIAYRGDLRHNYMTVSQVSPMQ